MKLYSVDATSGPGVGTVTTDRGQTYRIFDAALLERCDQAYIDGADVVPIIRHSKKSGLPYLWGIVRVASSVKSLTDDTDETDDLDGL